MYLLCCVVSGLAAAVAKFAADTEQGSEIERPAKRQRRKKVIFTHYYYCHRRGEKRVQKGVTPGGVSGQIRSIQKESKKVGCLARLTVRCYPENPSEVYFKYEHDHTGHIPGSTEDVQYLPKSKGLRAEIMQHIANGYLPRDISTALQHKYNNAGPNKRESYIMTTDIYNIYYHCRVQKFCKDKNDFVSVGLWLTDLSTRAYSTWQYTDNLDEQCFTFGFASQWQLTLLQKAKFLSLDATHDVCMYDRGILYTIVIRHPVAGRGVPVAYLITNDHSTRPLAAWFSSLKEQNVHPVRITIDCSLPEDNAIQAVWGDDTTVQFCTWHVMRAWQQNIRTKVTASHRNRDERIISYKHEIRETLKEIMYEKNVHSFHERLTAFNDKWSDTQPEFCQYFEQQWLDNDRYKKWAACYQPNVYSNMETNNYVESWHNQLKTVYLRRRRQHRLDIFMGIMTTAIEFDIKNQIRRLSMNVGRMSANTRHDREQQLKADSIPMSDFDHAVQMQDPCNFYVRSFFDDDAAYKVCYNYKPAFLSYQLDVHTQG